MTEGPSMGFFEDGCVVMARKGIVPFTVRHRSQMRLAHSVQLFESASAVSLRTKLRVEHTFKSRSNGALRFRAMQ